MVKKVLGVLIFALVLCSFAGVAFGADYYVLTDDKVLGTGCSSEFAEPLRQMRIDGEAKLVVAASLRDYGDGNGTTAIPIYIGREIQCTDAHSIFTVGLLGYARLLLSGDNVHLVSKVEANRLIASWYPSEIDVEQIGGATKKSEAPGVIQ